MIAYRNLSIKAKLAAIALLACVTALLLACVALFVYEVLSFKRTLVRDLRAQATTLAGLSTAALTFDDKATAGEILVELKGQRHIKWAVIFKDGAPFASYRNPSFVGRLPAQPPADFGEAFGAEGLLLHTAIQLKGERVGTLQLAADTSQLGARLWEYGQILLVVFLAASLVAVFLAARLQRVSGATELISLADLIDDALRISASALGRHRIELVRKFESVPQVSVDRHKVMQILVNLVTNAKQALDARADGRRIGLHLSHVADDRLRVEVIDNGAGIAAENLSRIFNQGFTTKKSGHGFGLLSTPTPSPARNQQDPDFLCQAVLRPRGNDCRVNRRRSRGPLRGRWVWLGTQEAW